MSQTIYCETKYSPLPLTISSEMSNTSRYRTRADMRGPIASRGWFAWPSVKYDDD